VDDIWVAVDLPPETMFADYIFPVEEYQNLTLQDDGRRLVWSVGRLEPEQQAILAFQLVVQPQSLEALESPLIGPAEGRGRDLWSNQILSFGALEVREVSQMPEESPFN